MGHRNKLGATLAAQIAESNRLRDVGDDIPSDPTYLSGAFSAPSPPSDPILGTPFNGFRWIDTTSGIEYSYYDGIWAEQGGRITFPGSPASGQAFVVGDRHWKWNGIGWQRDITSPGWATPSGALSRTSYATYTAPANIGASPSAAQVQAIVDNLQIVSQKLAALITDLMSKGLLSP